MPKVESGLLALDLIRSASDIEFVRPRHIAYAYVIYDQHYADTVPKVLLWLESQRIFSAGRFARWEYTAMEDALDQGMVAAHQAKELD